MQTLTVEPATATDVADLQWLLQKHMHTYTQESKDSFFFMLFLFPSVSPYWQEEYLLEYGHTLKLESYHSIF